MYLQAHPNSAVAINLKACNHFRLYNGKAAEVELKALTDQVRMGGERRQRQGGRGGAQGAHGPGAHGAARKGRLWRHTRPCLCALPQGVSVEDSDLLRHNLVVFRRCVSTPLSSSHSCCPDPSSCCHLLPPPPAPPLISGENALRVLPGLAEVIPEARLNLVIFHLRAG